MRCINRIILRFNGGVEGIGVNSLLSQEYNVPSEFYTGFRNLSPCFHWDGLNGFFKELKSADGKGGKGYRLFFFLIKRF